MYDFSNVTVSVLLDFLKVNHLDSGYFFQSTGSNKIYLQPQTNQNLTDPLRGIKCASLVCHSLATDCCVPNRSSFVSFHE